jgi:predicted transcriptional regulator
MDSMSEHYAFILINAQKWWNRRISQNRAGKEIHAFVRRGIVGPKAAQYVLFYVKHPLREIRGRGEFIERVTGNVDELWKDYSHETVFKSHEEYFEFLQGRTKTTFIRLKDVRELSTSIPLKTVSGILGVNVMPRGGRYLNKETFEKLAGSL